MKYVITLDTDTQLPRDAAHQFVGTMAHPLNRPVYDPVRQRIRAGYGILQPRVSVSLPGANESRYARLHGGEPGIDPYTRAVSDVYQDAFQEGSFIGKGIYDVDAFELALKGRFPDNRILSHDLLEGCYARAGLFSDVQLYEEYPARYERRCRPSPSLDSRRLAGRALAPAVGARARWAAPQECDLHAVALEIIRQPAPQPGASRFDAASPAWLDGVFVDLVLDPGGALHLPDPGRPGHPA